MDVDYVTPAPIFYPGFSIGILDNAVHYDDLQIPTNAIQIFTAQKAQF